MLTDTFTEKATAGVFSQPLQGKGKPCPYRCGRAIMVSSSSFCRLALSMIHWPIIERIQHAMAENLETIGQSAIDHLTLKHAARERALPKSRTAIRYCANSIRAAHRQEFQAAQELLSQAATLIAEMAADLQQHQDIYYAG